MARATIRRVRPDEAAELTRLGARLFEATYRHLVDPADMAAHLASVFAADLQRAELIDPDVSTFLVHADDTPCGYLQVRRAPTPDAVDHAASIELRWFYLDPAFHGQGVAAEMMAAARVAARELGGAEMWLSVWRENPRAIAFYHKCGFMQVGTSEFDVGEDRRMDLIMVTSVREQIV
jgi:ribosomal protein S18 acetylase RimI-like enzyme